MLLHEICPLITVINYKRAIRGVPSRTITNFIMIESMKAPQAQCVTLKDPPRAEALMRIQCTDSQTML